jgi:hypothetical protein
MTVAAPFSATFRSSRSPIPMQTTVEPKPELPVSSSVRRRRASEARAAGALGKQAMPGCQLVQPGPLTSLSAGARTRPARRRLGTYAPCRHKASASTRKIPVVGEDGGGEHCGQTKMRSTIDPNPCAERLSLQFLFLFQTSGKRGARVIVFRRWIRQ